MEGTSSEVKAVGSELLRFWNGTDLACQTEYMEGQHDRIRAIKKIEGARGTAGARDRNQSAHLLKEACRAENRLGSRS